jgi:hypothetical protein
MNTQTDPTEQSPPLEPNGEETTEPSAAFLEACRSNTSDLVSAMKLELGKQLTSRHAVWGTIWRADFKIPGSDFPTLVNRIMCWQEGEKFTVMVAIGQPILPLR